MQHGNRAWDEELCLRHARHRAAGGERGLDPAYDVNREVPRTRFVNASQRLTLEVHGGNHLTLTCRPRSTDEVRQKRAHRPDGP